MKAVFRSRAVQSLLAWLISAYVEVMIATLRWRFENRGPTDAAMDSSEGLIGLLWHGRIAQGMACRPVMKTKPRRVMISMSRDGEFIAMAAERVRIPTIRGSAGRGNQVLAKGGAAAFRQALKFIRQGGVMLLTPDGPRGPREVMPLGPTQMARAAGCPVFLLGLAARPALALGSWDRGRLPLPFARACLVLDGPLRVPAEAEEADLETIRADWQIRMRLAQDRAESLLAKPIL